LEVTLPPLHSTGSCDKLPGNASGPAQTFQGEIILASSPLSSVLDDPDRDYYRESSWFRSFSVFLLVILIVYSVFLFGATAVISLPLSTIFVSLFVIQNSFAPVLMLPGLGGFVLFSWLIESLEYSSGFQLKVKRRRWVIGMLKLINVCYFGLCSSLSVIGPLAIRFSGFWVAYLWVPLYIFFCFICHMLTFAKAKS
jgi:hypothetical protein